MTGVDGNQNAVYLASIGTGLLFAALILVVLVLLWSRRRGIRLAILRARRADALIFDAFPSLSYVPPARPDTPETLRMRVSSSSLTVVVGPDALRIFRGRARPVETDEFSLSQIKNPRLDTIVSGSRNLPALVFEVAVAGRPIRATVVPRSAGLGGTLPARSAQARILLAQLEQRIP